MKIKTFLAAVLVVILVVSMLCGCNRQLIDTTYSFERAVVSLPDGTIIDGKVDRWIDYDDGDQIQVKISGKTYLVHSEDIAMISE